MSTDTKDGAFQSGDRVTVLNVDFCILTKKSKSTVIGKVAVIRKAYYISFDNSEIRYDLKFEESISGKNNISWNFRENEIAKLVHDSKLARNLYKNKIDKIEDGKIYLK
jgi:hypothetical protein